MNFDPVGHQQLNWELTKERAKGMTDDELRGAIKDAFDAGLAAWELERTNNPVIKTQGYYHDEISVYRHEIAERNRREQALGVL
jgi:hypothetical protein